MRKCFTILIIITLYALFPSNALAVQQHRLDELGFEIELPDEWIVLTPNNLDEEYISEYLTDLGVDRDELLELFSQQNVFLNVLVKPLIDTDEFSISLYDNPYGSEMDQVSEQELAQAIDEIVSEDSLNVNSLVSMRSLSISGTLYMVAEVVQIDNSHTYRYAAITNDKFVIFALRSEDKLTSEQKQELDAIMQSVHFDAIDTPEPTPAPAATLTPIATPEQGMQPTPDIIDAGETSAPEESAEQTGFSGIEWALIISGGGFVLVALIGLLVFALRKKG